MERCDAILEELAEQVKQLRPPQTKAGKRETVMIPMRDGKKLYTRFIYPEGMEKGIVTFQRTCYEFQIPIFEWMACRMAERGYISGYQLSRGIGCSEGEWEPFVHERSDGIDTVQWLQEQEFAEQIGLYGLSYGGYTQWLIADCLPDKIKTLVIAQAGIDRYHSVYANGCFRHDVYTAWALENAGFTLQDFYPECCAYRPFADMDQKVLKKRLPWFEEWLLHTDENDAYWKEGMWADLKCVAQKLRVPVCILGGWYDHHLEGMYYAWEHLPQNIRNQSRFLIGPWLHGLQNGVDAYEIHNHEHDSCFGFNEAFRWLDGFFGKAQKPETGLIGYMIGKDDWVRGEAQAVEERPIQLFPADAAQFVHDPKRPLPVHGGESMLYAPPELRGSRKQKKQRDERIAVFYSEPLPEEVAVSGSIEVRFRVVSDCEDTAVVVKLMEEFEHGDAYNIRNMASTLSAQKGDSGTDIQGAEVSVELTLWPVMWTFRKGSRMRLEISSSHFPEYHVHTNTAGSWAVQSEEKVAVNRVVGNVCVVIPQRKA